MSKHHGDGGGFTNRAARKFRDVNKVDLISQEDVFEILDQDLSIILDQMTRSREHQNGAKYPQYVEIMFANLSVPLYFYEFVNEHVEIKKNGKKWKTDLSESEVESLKQILAIAYRKSMKNFYSKQTQEFVQRNKLISKAFARLDMKHYRMLKKLGLSNSQRRDLTIQVYGDPVYNVAHIHKRFNESNMKEQKKIKLLKKLYEDRFVNMCGAAMTIDSNSSDFVGMIFDYVNNKKKKKRARYLKAYADAYKHNLSFNRLRINDEFIDKNKKVINELEYLDIGYEKAFDIHRGFERNFDYAKKEKYDSAWKKGNTRIK